MTYVRPSNVCGLSAVDEAVLQDELEDSGYDLEVAGIVSDCERHLKKARRVVNKAQGEFARTAKKKVRVVR